MSDIRPTPTWVYALVAVPDGLFRGFLTIAFSFIAAKSGMPLGIIGGIIAAGLFAVPAKLLWMPVVDLTGTLRGWFAGGTAASAACILLMVVMPLDTGHAFWLGLAAFVGMATTTLAGMAGSALLALTLPPERLSVAAGYLQGGNLVAVGLGGAASLWLATNAGATVAAATMAAATLAALLLVALVREPVRPHLDATVPGRLRAIGSDLWETARRRRGLFVLIAFATPIGVGGASMLWAGVASEWHAGAGTVALVTGVGSALATAGGAMAYGLLIGRMNRMTSFLLTGVILCAVAVLVAVSPRTATMFAVTTTIYALCLGCSYTSFTALQFEVMGKGAAASKYCLLNALGNLPLSYMPWLLGIVHDRSSSTGMLLSEAGLTLVVIAVFAGLRGAAGWRIGTPALTPA